MSCCACIIILIELLCLDVLSRIAAQTRLGFTEGRSGGNNPNHLMGPFLWNSYEKRGKRKQYFAHK